MKFSTPFCVYSICKSFTFHVFFLLCSGISLFSCGDRIFYATFESDTVGSLPNENPPESPTGDVIYTSGGSIPNMLRVQDGTPLQSTTNLKSLEYRNVNTPLYNRYVGFISKEVSLDADKTFYAVWTGRFSEDNSGSGIQIWLGNSHFLPIAVLQFKNGMVSIQTSGGSNTSYEEIGNLNPESNHTVIIRVDKASQTYNVSVFQQGGNLSVSNQAVVNASALNTQRPSLYLWYNENKSGSGRYVIDNVLITEKEPETE